ncbi:CAAX prenyl protease-related protein [Thermodesulfobacteriota bacterium]
MLNHKVHATPNLSRRAYIPYIVPFALFAVSMYAAPLFNTSQFLAYPIKTILVAASLVYFWNAYKQEIRFTFSWLAVISGVVVFFIWVLPEGLYPQIGHSEFNPYEQASGYGVYFLIAFRLVGAALIVPIMEELFWRSFVLRFAIKSEFKSLPLGQFSWFSFIFTSLLFGFEHHRWLVGIVAGMVYAGVLYRRKNLFDPILSHAITNFLLGIYVVLTHQWSFW